jgi:hypothetical protein
VGKGKYAMSEYEKIKRITFPLGEDHLLLVTTEVDANHSKIIKRHSAHAYMIKISDFKSFYIINYDYVMYQK